MKPTLAEEKSTSIGVRKELMAKDKSYHVIEPGESNGAARVQSRHVRYNVKLYSHCDCYLQFYTGVC